MKIDYKETTNDLLARIDIHSKYGSRNIDDWMLNLLKAPQGSKILDVGCGAGKQCFLFLDALQGQAEITGGDVNAELLAKARKENEKRGNQVEIIELDFNQRFPLPDDTYNLVTSCFAIYYASDIPYTIKEMHRVLKPGGHLFTTGPMPENKSLFYEVIKAATGKPIPPMPGSSRYSTHILSAIQSQFTKVEVHTFKNPLVFDSVDPFLSYTRASLSEDRRLWKDLFDGPDAFEQVMGQISTEATRRLKQDGQLIMTKVVGGFIATK